MTTLRRSAKTRADFTDREYEKYFLFDTVHFGWTGWVDVEEAIYDFVNQAQE